MPQWRKLWAKYTESEDVNDMPDDFARLTWAIMPIALDCEGRAQDDASLIRSKLFPKRRDVSLEMVETALCWYAERRMIVRYQANGRRYFHVPTFKLYQGKTDREAVSVIPEPPRHPGKPGRFSRKVQTTLPVDASTQSGPTHDLVRTRSTLDVEESRGEAEEKREELRPQKTGRHADPVFDAIVEVCAVDITIPGAGRSVGAVAAALKKAIPPYSGDEIIAWGKLQGWRNTPPSVWQLKTGVSTIRAKRTAGDNGAKPGAVGGMLAYIEELEHGNAG